LKIINKKLKNEHLKLSKKRKIQIIKECNYKDYGARQLDGLIEKAVAEEQVTYPIALNS